MLPNQRDRGLREEYGGFGVNCLVAFDKLCDEFDEQGIGF